MLSQLGISVLSQSKRDMIRVSLEIVEFYSKENHYQDTDLSNIHIDHYQMWKEACYVGNNIKQGRKD